MEEIIYLEPDEEITTVIDRIRLAKEQKLILVVPRDATLLQSVVNLKLLLKESSNLAKEIALVTSDKIGRNLASQVGLLVYDSIKDRRPIYQPNASDQKENDVIEIDMRKEVEEAPPKGISVHHFQSQQRQITHKNKPSLEPQWTKTPKIKKVNWGKATKIVWPMMIIVILLLLVSGYLLLPKVLLTLKVKAEDFQKEDSIDIVTNQDETKDSTIFVADLSSLSKSKEQKFSSTGKKNLGGKSAGTLTIYNYWDSNPQNFPAGTKFSSSAKTFLSKSTVTVPGTSIRGGNPIPGTSTVDIEAEKAGEEYNVKSGRFSIIGLSAPQQEKIYGQSSKDLTGGYTKDVTVVSEEDYDKAKEILVNNLKDDLKNQIKQERKDMEIIDKAMVFTESDLTSSAQIDAEASDFTMKITEKLTAMIFNREKFDEFIIKKMESQLSSEKMITLGPSDAINIIEVEPRYDEGKLGVKFNLTAKVSSRIDKEKIKQDLLGSSNKEINEYLKNIQGLEGYDIVYWPTFWLKRIPNFQKDFSIKLEYIEKEKDILPSPSVEMTLSPSQSPSSEVNL